MVIGNFWHTKFPDENYSKSASEMQRTNQFLSTVALISIPVEKREQVGDYILFALLHETIEPAIKDKLEYLLEQLQKLQATS